MISHPRPAVLARNLRQLADRLDDKGDRAIRSSIVLAARGWPTTASGNTDGTRPTGLSSESSTERSALNPGPFDDIDGRFTRQLRLLATVIFQIHDTMDLVATHQCMHKDCDICADQVPPGTGKCLRCMKLVRPDKRRPHNRIQAGFCPACYRRWVRLGRPDRSTYIRTPDEEVA